MHLIVIFLQTESMKKLFTKSYCALLNLYARTFAIIRIYLVHIKVYVYIRKKCEMYFPSLCKAFTCDSCETHSVAFFNIQKSKLKSLVALKRKNMHFKNEKSDKFSAKFFMTFPLKFFLKNYITDPMIFFISYKFLSNKL